jgi:hypothetical protein
MTDRESITFLKIGISLTKPQEIGQSPEVLFKD